MAIKRPIRQRHGTSEIPALIRLWTFRILAPLGASREFVTPNGFRDDSYAELLGLEALIDSDSQNFNARRAKTEIRRIHQKLELQAIHSKLPDCLSSNLDRLVDLVGLSDTDRSILAFAVMLHTERFLDDCADWLGQLSSVKVFHALSVLLCIPEQEIRAALSSTGLLVRSGLLWVDRNGTSTLRGKLNLLSDAFADHICSTETDPINLLRDTVALSVAGQVGIDEYEHIGKSLSVLRPYLRRAHLDGRRGVNIFFHGNPGTGKTELARALAHELGCELFEVASQDADGDPIVGERRLRAFRAAQSFFFTRKVIILFDEVEDVFNDGDQLFGRKSTAQTRKAWINRMLEENSVPTLWLSNSIDGLDPAFVRRFDMVFELPVPPRKQRKQLLADTCSDLLDPATIGRISESEDIAPAIVTRAASVVRSVRQDLGEAGAGSAFELLVNNTLEAQGYRAIRKGGSVDLPEVYDPAFIQADTDLAKVAAGLVTSRMGRICLYGPPGTGKTAYGRWLADQLDAPLITKRASDLISMWVGQTEKNIAKAFRLAERDAAVLLIDEVDSFLRDRREANHSWEVTEVNEMLTQMEAYSGVFLASTNLMSGLDQAALRRFDLKVKFDYLAPQQAVELFRRYCKTLAISPPSASVLSEIMHLPLLTPGDFAAVARRNRFSPLGSDAALARALEEECRIKEGFRSPIGFLHA